MSRSSPGSNSMVPTAAVLPTLKMLTVPVLMPEELTTAATWSVRLCMTPCPLVLRKIRCW